MMEKLQHSANSFTYRGNSVQQVSLKNIIARYSYHWPLFVIALAITLPVAYLYVKKSKPVYEVKASLMIKDGKKTPDQQTPLQELDISTPSKIVENEIETLKSKRLITQVVNDLQLWLVYEKQGANGYTDMYKKSPVNFKLLSTEGTIADQDINIIIKDKDTYAIQTSTGKLNEFKFNSTLKNSLGRWQIQPTELLTNYIGSTIRIKVLDPNKLALKYQTTVSASLLNKLATTIELSLNDEVAQRGQDILNQLIHDYNLNDEQNKFDETNNTIAFLEKRLSTVKEDLNNVESNVAGFKTDGGFTDIGSETQMNLEKKQANDTRLNEVKIQLNLVEDIERYINSPQTSAVVPSTYGISDPTLTNAIATYAKLQLEREKFLANAPEASPDFEPIARQLKVTKNLIKENVTTIKAALTSTMAQMQNYNSGYAAITRKIPVQEKQFSNIQRLQTSREKLYNYLLQKKEELSLSYSAIVANHRVVDYAYVSAAGNPKKKLTFLIAAVLSFIFPVVIINARSAIQNKIVDISEIKNNIGIPVLGDLPFKRGSKALLFEHEGASMLSEQMRTMRTKLNYLHTSSNGGRVTLVTSSVAGEGKSFVSTNISLSMAVSGRKTILIELDLRKPKISQIFGLKNDHPGITDFLNGTAALPYIIQQSPMMANMDIVCCGAEVKNPAELLETKKLKDLITQLKENYDEVIIDSPPVHLVTDALILSGMADITLYVIRQGFTSKVELDFLKELHEKNHLTNINIVFNGIQNGKYGYGYNYDSSYYMPVAPKAKFSNAVHDFLGRF